MTKKISSDNPTATSTDRPEDRTVERESDAAGSAGAFNPARFRLSQDFAATVGGTKHILNVPIRRPKKHEWVQAHADEAWRLTTAMLHMKEERDEYYVVVPEMWSALAGQIVPVLLGVAVNSHGAVFLWPVRLPGHEGRANAWHVSGVEAYGLATKGDWVRVEANMVAGAYEVFTAVGNLGEPVWPEMGFAKLFEKAVRDRLIDSPSHPVVRHLRGEA